MLTYKGKESFTTLFGGFVSVLIYVAITIYGLNLFTIMIDRGDTKKSRSSEVKNLKFYDHDIYPRSRGFDFGVLITDSDGVPIPIDPTIFSLSMKQVTVTQTSPGSISTDSTDLDYEL